jgi:hypothetical protein
MTASIRISNLTGSRHGFVNAESQRFLEDLPLFNLEKKSNYVWGNVPAIDCLNIPRNEGLDASTTDLKLCFAGTFRLNS